MSSAEIFNQSAGPGLFVRILMLRMVLFIAVYFSDACILLTIFVILFFHKIHLAIFK